MKVRLNVATRKMSRVGEAEGAQSTRLGDSRSEQTSPARRHDGELHVVA